MNKDKYEAMSPAQKYVIDYHCTTEWAEKIASPWADFEPPAAKQEAMPRVTRSTKSPPSKLTVAQSRSSHSRQNGQPGEEAGFDPDAVYADLRDRRIGAGMKKRNSLAE